MDYPADLDASAQDKLLQLVDKVFTEEDNDMLERTPSKKEVYETLCSSNLKSSAGSDGIPGLIYKECWDTLGDSLHGVVKELFSGSLPTTSMRTAMMNFCAKPKKLNSLKPSDKRRISVLNCDFKMYEGLIARRFRKIGDRTLSPIQYVAGTNRKIHHGIARARDAVYVASQLGLRCGIGDQDYIAAFDFLVLSWVWKVLERKGIRQITKSRLENLFMNGITVPVINSFCRRAIHDRRGSLRQGGCGSMEWFAFGIDPLLIFLDRHLQGIPIHSLTVLGPPQEGEPYPLPPVVERFKAVAYCDDVKPAICSLDEFLAADEGADLFERAAGTKLHRDPNSDKCKFLPLGRWRRELTQADIPTPYMKITSSLDMVGVKLCATWSSSRALNGDIVKDKVKQLIGSWRAGKFMPLTQRPLSANTFALSKVWFRCFTVNLRKGDYASINSSLKSWIYSDLILKPEEMMLFQPNSKGGLSLSSVKHKSLACLIRNFLEIAANPCYINSQYETSFYDYYVLDIPNQHPPVKPPFYTDEFFQVIKNAKHSGLNIINMSIKQWYRFLLKQEFSDMVDADMVTRPCRIERLNPTVKWDIAWKNVHLKALRSTEISFAWKLIHDLLPTEERLYSTIGNSPETCKFLCIGNPLANLEHCLLSCSLTCDVGSWLLDLIRKKCPSLNVKDILWLQMEDCDALVWIVVKTLFYCWNQRVSCKRAEADKCVSLLLADLRLMMPTQFVDLATNIGVFLDATV